MLLAGLLVGASCCCSATTTRPARLRLARIENVPDQLVGSAILAVAYRHLGIEVEFVDMPAKRALVESSQGRVDGEVHRVEDVGREYPSLLVVRPSINHIQPTVFVTGQQLRVAGWNSLAPYSIGIVRGVGSSERGTRGMKRVEAVTSMQQLMEMLVGGRIDLAVNDSFSGQLVVCRMHLDARVHALSPVLDDIALYHFLNEQHRDLLPRIEGELRKMTDSGELQSIQRSEKARMMTEAGR